MASEDGEDEVDYLGLDDAKSGSVAEFKRVARAFLELYRVMGSVSRAAERIGYKGYVVRKLAKEDPDFADALEAARVDATDALEDEARRRAIHGERKLVTHRGVPVLVPRYDEAGNVELDEDGTPKLYPLYEVTRSDTLLSKLLTGHRPERFGEQKKHTHTFEGKVGVLMVPAAPTAAAWEAELSEAPNPHVIENEPRALPAGQEEHDRRDGEGESEQTAGTGAASDSAAGPGDPDPDESATRDPDPDDWLS